MTTDDFTKISFNAIPRAVTAMELAADNAGLTRTDTLNRAIQLYAAVTGRPLWTALLIVWRERANLRRFAAEDARARLAAGSTEVRQAHTEETPDAR